MKYNLLFDKKSGEENKMRKIFVLFMFILGNHVLFAGDIANFINIGFSEDSRYYMFAQYGVSDTAVYSEIYTVDVNKNSFIKTGINKKEYPVSSYPMDDGSGAFYKGLVELSSQVQKNRVDPLLKGRCLYVNINGEPVLDLEFRDFKTGKTYKINLLQSVSESNGPESSFGLKILAENPGEPSKAYSAGSPSIKRAGVKGYSIKSIYLTPDEKSMVLVIAKSVADKDSVSVRYMIESFAL